MYSLPKWVNRWESMWLTVENVDQMQQAEVDPQKSERGGHLVPFMMNSDGAKF